MILGRAPLPSEIGVGQPLPWAIHDRHGTLLLKRGEVIRSEDLLRAVLTRGIVRESDLAPQREREPVRVELIGPAYAKWVYGPEDTDQIIKGPASDWARIAVRRIDPSKTRLQVSGDYAEKAIQVAKAYL